jgi:Tol biopolymer transport system component
MIFGLCFVLLGCNGDAELAPSIADTPRAVFLARSTAAPDRPELFSVDADGTGRVQLSAILAGNDPVVDFRISPTGENVAFRANTDLGRTDLFVADTRTGLAQSMSSSFPAGSTIANDYAWSPDGERLAFRGTLNGLFRLFTVRADGALLTEISALVTASDIQDFAWSPDGMRIAFRAQNARSELMTSSAERAETVVVSTTVTDIDVVDYAWSPDGTRLAFRASAEPGNLALYSTRATFADVRRLSSVFPSDASAFAWSPTGQLIAYIADERADGIFELFTTTPTRAAGVSSTVVSGPLVAGGDVRTFAWSPAGTRIAYLADQNIDGVEELFVTSPITGAPSVVNMPLADGAVITFAWSSDARIAFLVRDGTTLAHTLFALDLGLDGGPITLSSPGHNVVTFAWSPDGQRIAYRTTELFTAFPTGDTPLQVSGEEGQVLDFVWSPESGQLFYRVNPADGTIRLFATDALVATGEDVSGADIGLVEQDYAVAPPEP